ncbi:MAG: hypothetical protein D6730_06935 [Bacteroidetes bacterium]|nr:MAG: hypothetical protein D6730_06935 [Bacteroidota bacterium]
MKQPHFIIQIPSDREHTTGQLLEKLGFSSLRHARECYTDGTTLLELTAPDTYAGVELLQPIDAASEEEDPLGFRLSFMPEKIFAGLELPGKPQSHCGTFYEISIPAEVYEFESTVNWWSSMGFEIEEGDPSSSTYVSLLWKDLRVSVYQQDKCPHLFDAPAITFFEPDMADRIQHLKARGIEFTQELSLANENGHTDHGILRLSGDFLLFLFAY